MADTQVSGEVKLETTSNKMMIKPEQPEMGYGSNNWKFHGNPVLNPEKAVSVRGTLEKIWEHVREDDSRPVVAFGNGDPSMFQCFRTTPVAEDAIIEALQTSKYNGYSSSVGILPARR